MPFKTVLVKGLGKIKFPAHMADEAIEASIKNLDMSEAARMARAKAQGFDTKKTFYHGTNYDIDELSTNYGKAHFTDPSEMPIFLTPSKSFSNRFSKGPGGNTIPAYLKIKNTFDYRNKEHIDKLRSKMREKGTLNESSGSGEYYDYVLGVEEGSFVAIERKEVRDAIKSLGYDSFIVTENNIYDRLLQSDVASVMLNEKEARILYEKKLKEIEKIEDLTGANIEKHVPKIEKHGDLYKVSYKSGEFKNATPKVKDDNTLNIAVFDPKNIRSVNAAFNPDAIDSPSLLASAAPAAVGLGALGANDAKASVTGTIQGPAPGREKIASVSEFIDKHDDIVFDDLLGGVTKWLDKVAYDDKRTFVDRLMAALDLMQ